jgi:hypothetical protein
MRALADQITRNAEHAQRRYCQGDETERAENTGGEALPPQ